MYLQQNRRQEPGRPVELLAMDHGKICRDGFKLLQPSLSLNQPEGADSATPTQLMPDCGLRVFVSG